MDSLQWETINRNEFNIFMRDLSLTTNTNLKHMIEDMNNEKQKNREQKQKQKQKKKKKVVMKKKDIIIAEQNKKRHLKDIESDKIQVSGFIVREAADFPSNFQSNQSINEYLVDNNIVGIQGLDTRAITRIIRDNGSMNAIISSTNFD